MNIDILMNSDNDTIKEEVSTINKDLINIYNDTMKDFHTDLLYDSEIHGLKHNIRVSIYTLLIVNQGNYSKEDLQILLEAAKYHDTGRINDKDDLAHGKRSSDMMSFLSNRYSDVDMNYLKSIVEAHSIPDAKRDIIAKKNKLDNIGRYHKLLNVLKDADALDRVRTADLDVTFLRTEKGKDLEPFAKELYKIYH